MIRQIIDLTPILPMKRQTAADIATLASRYDCTLVFEAHNLILNAKSMLGLLSMAMPTNQEITLVADGENEEAAIKTMTDLIHRLIAAEQ